MCLCHKFIQSEFDWPLTHRPVARQIYMSCLKLVFRLRLKKTHFH